MSMTDDSLQVRHNVLEPISFKADAKKAMHPVVADVSIDIAAHLEMIIVRFTYFNHMIFFSSSVIYLILLCYSWSCKYMNY